MSLHDKIRRAQIMAAEAAVIASIPPELKACMDLAQAAHEASGGCPGCGSMIHGVHKGGCPTMYDDIY
jgi:hypothetical protein